MFFFASCSLLNIIYPTMFIGFQAYHGVRETFETVNYTDSNSVVGNVQYPVQTRTISRRRRGPIPAPGNHTWGGGYFSLV